MREALDLVLGAVAEPAMHGLLHFLWQGSLVALLLAAVLVVARPRRAAVRYRLACGSLALMVALPVVTALRHGVADGDRPAAPVPEASAAQETAAPRETATLVRELARALPVEETSGALAGSLLRRVARRVEPADAAPWVLTAWLAGVLVFAVLHLGGWLRVRRLTRHDVTPAPAEWQERAERLGRALGLDRAVRVVRTAAVESPAVVGWLRPVVLLPVAALSGLPVAQLECILAHELAHVRRRDYLVNLLQTCAETLLFYHPAVWWVSRLIRTERENCCDDIAVAHAGSRVLYARALVDLEELRQATPRLAMGADGGSLLRRVERLIGGPDMSLQAHRNHLAGTLAALLLILGGSVFALAAQSQLGEAVALASGAELADVSVRGRWFAERDGDDLHLELSRREKGRHRGSWHSNMRVDVDDFDGLRFRDDVEFILARPAGTFTFTGDFDGDEGDGRFAFAANTEYLAELAEMGTRRLDEQIVVVLASENLELGTVRELRDMGYGPFDDDELVTIAIFEVTPAYIRDMEDAGYEDIPLDKLVAMRVHDVNRSFIEEMHEAGFEAHSVDDAIAWSVHEVDPHEVKKMREHFGHDLDADDMLAMKIHGVDHHYAEELEEAGLHDLRHDQLLAMKIHGVSAHGIHAMREHFDHDVDAEDVLAWNIHQVTPEYIAEIEDLGYDLEPEMLLAWKIHGVDREFIEELAELGYEDVDADDLTAMKIHGATPRWIRHLRERGIDDLSVEDLIKLRISGVEL